MQRTGLLHFSIDKKTPTGNDSTAEHTAARAQVAGYSVQRGLSVASPLCVQRPTGHVCNGPYPGGHIVGSLPLCVKRGVSPQPSGTSLGALDRSAIIPSKYKPSKSKVVFRSTLLGQFCSLKVQNCFREEGRSQQFTTPPSISLEVCEGRSYIHALGSFLQHSSLAHTCTHIVYHSHALQVAMQ